ncbi:uncharacterized protein LOC115005009 [Cottoperca gobio]|uniref:Uncharacterized protein LOC115005009 n=1 Tax=Cottoperca gobio TaxID=56716 RepID=A0A6J2P9C3_COTGO|nr:uncharacterized protein LOC115005009 [Cottoperca gobio]
MIRELLTSSVCQIVPTRSQSTQAMAPSQVSGMKMRNLLFGVILGLLAVVYSTPVNTVTQISAIAEDEIIREAVTDGFLVENFFLPSLTTESSKINTTIQATQQSTSNSKESDMTEDSAMGVTNYKSTTSGSLDLATTTLSVSHAHSSTSTVLPLRDTNSDSTTTQSPQSSFSSSSVPNEVESSITPDHISLSQTTNHPVFSFDSLSTQSSESGSGDREMFGPSSSTIPSMTTSSNTKTSSESSTFTTAFITQKAPGMFGGSEGSGFDELSGSGMETLLVPTTTTMAKKLRKLDLESFNPVQQLVEQPATAGQLNKGHHTPGWIIIVGFIVGLAALVMLFVAIATRDKWNGPSQSSQLETKTNFLNQQREVEMETFLHKDKPRENGKAEEYTVIPLDELPEKHSSQ